MSGPSMGSTGFVRRGVLPGSDVVPLIVGELTFRCTASCLVAGSNGRRRLRGFGSWQTPPRALAIPFGRLSARQGGRSVGVGAAAPSGPLEIDFDRIGSGPGNRASKSSTLAGWRPVIVAERHAERILRFVAGCLGNLPLC
jgi:hypothetical protein